MHSNSAIYIPLKLLEFQDITSCKLEKHFNSNLFLSLSTVRSKTVKDISGSLSNINPCSLYKQLQGHCLFHVDQSEMKY